MKYYIASIHKGDPRTNDFRMIEHYYAIRESENVKDRIIQSIKNSGIEKEVWKVEVYKHDFTIYDDELEKAFK